MATRAIGPVTIVANVEKDGGAAALPASVNSVMIQITDPNGVWATTPGNIKIWGVQCSKDGGVTWNWGPVFQGDLNDQSRWIPFGTLSRNGQLPALQISSTQLVNVAGDQLRLSIVTDANITLGASITTA